MGDPRPIEDMIPQATRATMESRIDWGDLLTVPLPDPAVLENTTLEEAP